MKARQLRDTKWLADILSVSVSCIEKRRAYFPDSLPKAIRVGRLVRYSEDDVQRWLNDQRIPSHAING